jgi:predicted kinase
MVGIPGSGKSTVARQRFPQALRISLDDLRLMLSGKPFHLPIEPAVAVAGDALRDSVAEYAAARGWDALFDATNVSRSRRAPLVACARRFGLSPVAVYVKCDLAVAGQRNRQRPIPVPDAVVTNFYRILEPPTVEEGFDEVVLIET